MTEAQLFPYLLAICGVMATTVFSLVAYIFLSSKKMHSADIAEIKEQLKIITGNMVRRETCKEVTDDFEGRLTDLEKDFHTMDIEMTRLSTVQETLYEKYKCSTLQKAPGNSG